MKKNSNEEFKWDIDTNFGDYILEESGNTSINLRKISWNERPFKIDIRKYTFHNGKEVAMRGIGLSEEATNELATVLVTKGYGNTKQMMKHIRDRMDYEIGMATDPNYDFTPDEVEAKSDFYEASELLNSNFNNSEDIEDEEE